jgi:membrane protein YdbS with pleckstrin-like domain
VPEPRDAVASHGHLRRYVLANERVVVATRRHWAKLLEPIATTLVAFLVIGAIVQSVPAATRDTVQWLWIVWFVVLARLGWKWLEWYHEWFVATDKRLLLAYGLLVHKVAMMPLAKVTDMGYTRTPLGQVIGFGRFVMESAGQEQALRQIDWVPHPDATYRKLVATIFQPGVQPAFPQPGSLAGLNRPPALVPRPRDDDARPPTQEIPVTRPGAGQTSGTGSTAERGGRVPGLTGERGSAQPMPKPPKSSGGGTTIPKPFL